MNSISGVDSSVLDSIGMAPPQAEAKGDMGQADFLKLMVAQLEHQDPMDPQDGTQFLGQMAQFGTLDGIQKMENSFARFTDSMQSNQALQASSLVGRKVGVESQVGMLPTGEGLQGYLDIPVGVSDLSMTFYNAAGESVRTMNLGTQQAGVLDYQWEGIDDGGFGADPGLYRVVAEATIDGNKTAIPTYVYSNVDSVSIDSKSQKVSLNLAGVGQRSLDEIQELK